MAKDAHGVAATRTFALVGHRSAGKTSLGDVLLQTAGVTRAIGRVDDGTSLLDHEPEERRRRMTLSLAFAWMDWEGYRLQLVDTPGSTGLAHEQSLAMATVDGAIVVISAPDGLELGARRALDETARARLPRIVALNKMDRVHDVSALITEIEAACSARVVPIQVPLWHAGRFAGVVPLIDQRVLRYDPGGSGSFSAEPLSAADAEAVSTAWEHLVEAVALTDDELLERYLEELELPADEVRSGLARAVREGRIVPLVYVSSAGAIGAHPLLDLVAWGLPSPAQRRAPWAVDADGADVRVDPDGGFLAQVVATRLDDDNQPFHVLRVWSGEAPKRGAWVHGETGATARINKLYQLRGPRAATAKYTGPGALIATWDKLDTRPGDTWTDGPRLMLGAPPLPPPMHAVRVAPSTPRAAQRLPDALRILQAIDPALDVWTDDVTGEPVLGGVGQEHLERALELLLRRFEVPVMTALPTVPYREMPAHAVTGVEGVHQKMADGLVSEYAACVVDIEPVEPGDPFTFRDGVPEQDVPSRFLPAVEEGARLAMRSGPIAGYPVVGATVRLVGGQYDILESTEDHFRLAAEKAVRTALERAGGRLLEPWWRIEVRVPAADVGLVLAELGARRARIQGLEVDEREAAVFAECPYRELRDFGPKLQSLTAGRGRYVGFPSHHDLLPANMVDQAVAERPTRAAP